ncbi:Mov34/MPN/PAD-1 family protein [Neisseria musculi]|uniref:JAB domain-containing protein n=1 Tax=Neisseria musculi TaxID=1815583 RepID=A0A7H1M9N4_9NEIS|nr:Mov34/MPN/PAD-1 family protein [Neisseria musculi]QNT58349.1 hypothetical protein H7A79_0731 [Neisseria musculi]
MEFLEWVAVDCDFTVRIDMSVLNQLAAFRQTLSGNEPESLGLLVGLVWPTAFWVKAATVPTPFDELNRFWCIRTEKSAEFNFHTLKRLNRQSNHQLHYLGEWHTHPQIQPTPSLTDHINWRMLPENRYFGQDTRLFVILGTESCSRDWLNIQINGTFFDLVVKNDQYSKQNS